MKLVKGERQSLQAAAEAIDKIEGMPRPPEHAGSNAGVPDEYYPGAPGWTEHVCALEPVSDENGALELEWQLYVPDDVAQRVDGQTVTLADGRQFTVNLSGATDLEG
jgi:hypothetical protein